MALREDCAASFPALDAPFKVLVYSFPDEFTAPMIASAAPTWIPSIASATASASRPCVTSSAS